MSGSRVIWRGQVAEKIVEWGSLVFSGLVIVQIVPGPLSDPKLLLVGIASIADVYWLALSSFTSP